jgi:hypothetical protein
VYQRATAKVDLHGKGAAEWNLHDRAAARVRTQAHPLATHSRKSVLTYQAQPCCTTTVCMHPLAAAAAAMQHVLLLLLVRMH